jgi:hypothetical protein
MNRDTVTISFVGPSSGNLILRLRHSATQPHITITVLGNSFTLAIPKSLTVDDINLHPIGSSSFQLTFRPNTRDNIILQTPPIGYNLQDVQLLDEDGNPYGQPSQRNIPATEFDALSMPDDDESS